MIRILGNPKRFCDGVTRRDLLTAGGISLFSGMTLQNAVAAEAWSPRREAERAGLIKPGKAKSVILLYLMGGPPQQDMWDLKPNAPAEVRGEFKPIPTSAPGVEICELLPKMAKWMHKSAIIRSAHHEGGDHNTLPSFTGYNGPSQAGTIVQQSAKDPPSMGSVVEYLDFGRGAKVPAYWHLPCPLGWGQAISRPGTEAGYLGQQYNPTYSECSAFTDKPALPNLPQVVKGKCTLPGLAPQVTADRLDRRRSLRSQVDTGLRKIERSTSLQSQDKTYTRAFDLLTSPQARAAFDLDKEPNKLRDRYGRTLFGETALIGRRLIETGARFVTVTWDVFWERIKADFDGWDTHGQNFKLLREYHLPYLDMTYSALMEDLEAKGLLDETLVIVMGEMGRTPKINGNAGRDHWTHCYSLMMSGAGIRGGTIHGKSDASAAYPDEDGVLPGDICSTIYHCLGIDPDLMVPDQTGRPFPISHGGKPIRSILA